MRSANNAQKTYLAGSLQRFAERKIADAVQVLGKALPCTVAALVGNTGAIVTINFDLTTTPFTLPQVTVPVLGFEYIRYPIQVGCKGVALPCDVIIGNVSGLGASRTNLRSPANLSSLVFVPVGNSAWSATDDANSLVLYGPHGVIIRDANNTASVKVSANQVQMKVGGNTVTVSSSGIDIEGTLTINGKLYANHEHSGVQTGSSFSGPVHDP